MKAAVSLAVLAIVATAAPAAFADKAAEAFVRDNANKVLTVLSDKSLNDAARREKFSTYMNQFANFPGIARRVLGSYGRTVSETDFQRYYKSFEAYSISVYEAKLVPFRGSTVEVNGSVDKGPRQSEVSTTVRDKLKNKDMKVVWDVLASQDGKSYRVRDVALETDSGAVIWMAGDQQKDFEGLLNGNKGSVEKLIQFIDGKNAEIARKKAAAKGGAY